MKREDIRIRDPFILAYDNMYYMYASTQTSLKNEDDKSFEKYGMAIIVYKSEDMENWTEPEIVFSYVPTDSSEIVCDLWAPEIHFYNGKFYAFISFKNKSTKRGTYLAVSDSPDGEFLLLSEMPLTPYEDSCIDGTLYVEDGIPYIVYSHDWPDCYNEVKDIFVGQICARRLSDDLKKGLGESFKLFSSDEADIVKNNPNFFKSQGKECARCGSDGPFLLKRDDGALLLFWSPMLNKNYVVMCAVSESGKLKGPWKHMESPVYDNNGGHPMIFNNFEGKKIMCVHSPEKWFDERLCYFEIE